MRRVDCRNPKQEKKSTTLWSIIPYIYDFDRLSFPDEAPRAVICKRKQSKQPFVKIMVFLFVVGASWFGMPHIPGTLGYFSDSETSKANLFSAGLLDFNLFSESDFTPDVSLKESSVRVIQIKAEHSIAFEYQVTKGNMEGELCDALGVQIFLGGEQKYSGPLGDFTQAGDFGFLDPQQWLVIAHIDENDAYLNKKSCTFDLVYDGWQISLFSGFHDVESITSTITANIPKDKKDKDKDKDDDKDDKDDKGDKGEKGDKPGEKGDKGDKPDERGDEENENEEIKYHEEENMELFILDVVENEEDASEEESNGVSEENKEEEQAVENEDSATDTTEEEIQEDEVNEE